MPGSPGRPETMGDIAHDSAETTTSFPTKIGGTAYDFDGTALPTDVAEADRTSARFTRDGRMLIETGHPYFFHTTVSYAAATTAAAPLINAPATGTSIYITDLIFTSNTLATFTLLQQVTSGSNLLIARVQAGGGHLNHSFKQPIKASLEDTTTAVTNVGLTTDVTVTTAFIAGYFAS